MASFKGSNFMMIIMILVGGLTGSAIADAAGVYVPFLKSIVKIGFDPFILDLHFITLTLGFKMGFSVLTALGLVVGYWVYQKI
ncbi:MAG: DUF4321 domain-containing protein [Eubacteriaceae bacterium]